MKHLDKEQRQILLRILLGSALLVILHLVHPSGILRLILYLIPYLILGYDVLWEAARNITKGKCLDECFLMTVATIGALCLGEYAESSAVMLFSQIGGLFESVALTRSQKSINDLMDIRPETAILIENGTERTVPPEEVPIGSVVLVRPGMRIPLDGTVISGETTADHRALTGESVPVPKTVGDTVYSGSINLTGAIQLRTTVTYENSTAAGILSLTETASARKAHTEHIITRFSRVYTPCVVIAAILVGILPPLFGQPWSVWIQRALIFLMISCPCALVVSVPMTFFSGIGAASANGILLKSATALETLSQIDAIALDKTGTLTEGKFAVTEINAEHPDFDAEGLLALAARLESQSTHPIAQAITAARKESGADGPDTITEHAGLGVRGIINNETYYIGNAAWMQKNQIPCPPAAQCGTVVYLAKEGEYLGSLVVADTIKPDSAAAIAHLKKLGVQHTVMLTGDQADIAETVGASVGVDEVQAELLPQDKVSQVETLLKAHKTAFAGDGINDAPVLMRADVGIAMGALGSEAAMEAADVVIMDDHLPKIADAILIARKTMRIVRQNIIFAIGCKLLILLLGALGYADLWLAVLGDVGVLILAVCNALRAQKRPRICEC